MRKRKRIGEGSRDWADTRNSKVWLRNEFLEIIEKLEPEKEKKPLGSLAQQPLEHYVNLIENQDERSISRRQKISEGSKPGILSFFSLLDEDDPLRKSIWQWGETFHLNSDWCYDVALRSLQDWHRFKEATGKRFESLPFYGHPSYLGFGSLVMVHRLAGMPRDSLNEHQKELVDSFSEQDRQFVEFFSEEQRAYLSTYYHDPHIQSDEQFIDTAKSLIENEEFINAVESLIGNALLSVITKLPVLNLLSNADRRELYEKIRCYFCEKIPGRASELLDRLHEAEKIFGSVKPMEVGADEVSKHLEWAVRYQVFDEKFRSIGPRKSEYARDKKSVAVNVRKQVLNMLDRVDLDPRPATIRRRSL